MSEEKKRGAVIDDAELAEHKGQFDAWRDKTTDPSRLLGLDECGICELATAYAYAIDGYEAVRLRFPGRLTSASKAIRSLEASIRGLWFELEGDKP